LALSAAYLDEVLDIRPVAEPENVQQGRIASVALTIPQRRACV
jgi:hypothetical protein